MPVTISVCAAIQYDIKLKGQVKYQFLHKSHVNKNSIELSGFVNNHIVANYIFVLGAKTDLLFIY